MFKRFMLENQHYALKIFLVNKEKNPSLVYDFSLKTQTNKPVGILEFGMNIF
jgi:hypothetical protein